MAGNTQAICFDIFDTVLTRRVGNPRAAFLLLGRRLHHAGVLPCSAQAFATARTKAEQRAFANHGGLDSSVSLAHIYVELANAIGLDEQQLEHIMGAEVDLERELLVVIPEGAQQVADARREGHRVMFVSDMYLSSGVLEDILRERGLFLDGDTLIVSNEHRASKRTGKLWPIVLEELGMNPALVHHVGNDELSDHKQARKAGLTTTLVDHNNMNRYEEALEKYSNDTDGLTSALAGASRLARISEGADGAGTNAVAAGVVAPFVIGKVLWVLEQAQQHQLDHLYFVARDGQLLHRVACELAPKVGYTGELTYLYGSRQAWSLAGMTAAGADHLAPIIPNNGDVDATLEVLLRRVDLETAEVTNALQRAGLDLQATSVPTPAERETLRDILATDYETSELLSTRAKEAREMVLGYFEQVGVLSSDRAGFVDLGTGATLFNSLNTILRSVGRPPTTGFYFGLRRSAESLTGEYPLTYISNHVAHLGYSSVPGLLTLVEMACTADHGSLVGYAEGPGGSADIVPVFTPDSNSAVVAWGLRNVHEIVARVAEQLVLDADLVGSTNIDLRPAILDVFNEFWGNPTVFEAETWGAYPFEDGWGGESFRHPIAGARPAHAAFMSQPYRHWWCQGANRLSGPVSRKLHESRGLALRFHKKVRARL